MLSGAAPDEQSKQAINEIQFILERSKESKGKQFVTKALASIAQVYTLEINQPQMTDDAWEMLDALEAMIMNACDGILYTDDNEFFDKDLQKIYKL